MSRDMFVSSVNSPVLVNANSGMAPGEVQACELPAVPETTSASGLGHIQNPPVVIPSTLTEHGGNESCKDFETPISINPENEGLLQYADILYKCTLCRTVPCILTSKEKFIGHMENQHSSKSDNANFCKYCSLKFQTDTDIMLHSSSSHPNTAHSSGQCKEVNGNGNSQCTRTNFEGNLSTEIANDVENDELPERSTISDKQERVCQKDENQSSPNATHPSIDMGGIDKQSGVHFIVQKQKGQMCIESPVPRNPQRDARNTSERIGYKTTSPQLCCPGNVCGSNVTQEPGNSPDRNRQSALLSERKCVSEANHETSAECLSRLHELTDQIMASCLCRTKTPCFVQEMCKPCFTKEFGKYTKLVREGGNIVYFCQACNWKSPSRPEFYLHCSRQCHVSRLKMLDTPNECQRNKADDGATDSNRPQCYGSPVQFYNPVPNATQCRLSPARIGSPYGLFQNPMDSSYLSQTPLNLAKRSNLKETEIHTNGEAQDTLHVILDKISDTAQKQNIRSAETSPKPEAVEDLKGHDRDYFVESLHRTPYKVQESPLPEKDTTGKHIINNNKGDRASDELSKHGGNHTLRRRRKRPAPRMVRNQDSLCHWTDMSDSNSDSDVETSVISDKKRRVLFQPQLSSVSKPPPFGANHTVTRDSANRENVRSPNDADQNSSLVLHNREAHTILATSPKCAAESDKETKMSPTEFFSVYDRNCGEDITSAATRKHLFSNSHKNVFEHTSYKKSVECEYSATISNRNTFGDRSPPKICIRQNSAIQNCDSDEEIIQVDDEQTEGGKQIQVDDDQQVKVDHEEQIRVNKCERIHDSNEQCIDTGDVADVDEMKICNREGWKISKIKDILSDFISESTNGNISRDNLLVKVSQALSCTDAVNWGPACNRAVREEFPASIAQRKGKYKNLSTTYFFGVQFVNDRCITTEAMDGDTFSVHPLRDMSRDTEKIMQYLPDFVFWSGDLDTGVARDELLTLLEEKISDSNVLFWGIECNRAVRRLYPGVHTRRRGKYKTVFYGLRYRPHVMGDPKNVKCINRTPHEFLECVPDDQHPIGHHSPLLIPNSSTMVPENPHEKTEEVITV